VHATCNISVRCASCSPCIMQMMRAPTAQQGMLLLNPSVMFVHFSNVNTCVLFGCYLYMYMHVNKFVIFIVGSSHERWFILLLGFDSRTRLNGSIPERLLAIFQGRPNGSLSSWMT
jgi:hypothetical protein